MDTESGALAENGALAERMLAEVAGLLADEPDLRSALRRTSRLATEVVPDADSASITLRRSGVSLTVGATDDDVADLDEVQYASSRGPCVETLADGRPRYGTNEDVERLWPAFGTAVRLAGMNSVRSEPLMANHELAAVLNLYSRKPEAFGADAERVLSMFTRHMGPAIHSAKVYYGTKDLALQLQEAMSSRAVIEQAKGIVMARRGCDADTAFATMVKVSQDTNTKLRVLAHRIVTSV